MIFQRFIIYLSLKHETYGLQVGHLLEFEIPDNRIDRNRIFTSHILLDTYFLKAKTIEQKKAQAPVSAIPQPVETAVSSASAGLTLQQPKSTSGDALPCTNCGSLALVRNGTCHLCTNCGTTTGCS